MLFTNGGALILEKERAHRKTLRYAVGAVMFLKKGVRSLDKL